jgi:hypothetical protein
VNLIIVCVLCVMYLCRKLALLMYIRVITYKWIWQWKKKIAYVRCIQSVFTGNRTVFRDITVCCCVSLWQPSEEQIIMMHVKKCKDRVTCSEFHKFKKGRDETVCAVMSYSENRVTALLICILGAMWRWAVISHTGWCAFGKEPSCTLNGGWVGPRASLDV